VTGPALSFDRVAVRYEAHAAPTLEEVSLSIAPHERVALVGLNGSGKTTLLMAAAGLVPYKGQIRVLGTVVSRQTLQEVRRSMGFLFNVPEDQLLFPKVLDDVAFGLVRKGTPPQEAGRKARGVLDALGVGAQADAPLHHLSHGQKQRVALAGALVTEPPLLLLDEPTAALDPPGKRGLARLLASLDAAMLVATHDLEFAESLCSRFVMVEQGKVAYDGPNAARVSERWETPA